ncbi:hypothetical protein CsSME_00017348 [Camellia sinensis var. sinensis]
MRWGLIIGMSSRTITLFCTRTLKRIQRRCW